MTRSCFCTVSTSISFAAVSGACGAGFTSDFSNFSRTSDILKSSHCGCGGPPWVTPLNGPNKNRQNWLPEGSNYVQTGAIGLEARKTHSMKRKAKHQGGHFLQFFHQFLPFSHQMPHHTTHKDQRQQDNHSHRPHLWQIAGCEAQSIWHIKQNIGGKKQRISKNNAWVITTGLALESGCKTLALAPSIHWNNPRQNAFQSEWFWWYCFWSC